VRVGRSQMRRTHKPLQLPWIRGDPAALLARWSEGTSSVLTLVAAWLWKGQQDQRSPLRRCFKPRPLLRAELRRFRLLAADADR